VKTAQPMNGRLSRRCRSSGFTLTEILVSSFLSTLVIAGALTGFVQYRRAMDAQKTESSIQQNLRIGMTALARDISMAGYGLDVDESRLSQWLSWAPLASNPQIQQGSGDSSDTLMLAGAFEQVSTLTATSGVGETRITVEPGAVSKFNMTNRKLIYIGECELARIVGIANNVLTISTDPTTPTKGLKYSYPIGAPVELVKVYSYTIDHSFPSADFPTCLRRTDMANTSTYWFEEVITAGIEQMKVRQSGNTLDVSIRGRSMKIDPSHIDPVFGDHYHRLTVSNSVYMRNL
jgi:type II secretory pathway pseudopilin PulG